MGAAAMVKGDTRSRPGLPAAAGIAFLFALICYVNTFSNQFVFDDIDIITRNPLVTSPSPDVPKIFASHYWQHLTPTGELYRPLVILSYAVNHAIGGLDPAGFHLVNLLLHALCSALVVSLAYRFGLSIPGALAAGLLFAAHPIHTEAVTGLVGRAELMAALAVLAAWRIHLSTTGAIWIRPVAMAGFFVAGLLSKENAVVLPGLMIAFDLLRVRLKQTEWRRLLPAYVVCGVVILCWLALRAVLLSPPAAGSGYQGPFAGVAATTRVLTALSVMGRYMLLLVRPTLLSADYSFEQIPMVTSWSEPLVWVSALILAGLTFFVIRGLVLGRGSALSSLSTAAFLIAVLPVSNLLVPIGTIMGERLLYLPSVGFCLLLPSLWMSLAGRLPSGPVWRRTGVVLAGMLVILYAARTLTRNGDWKDQLTLFSVTSITSPGSGKTHYNLGVALEDAGRTEEALREYETAISINPQDAKSHLNAGLLLGKMDRAAEASMHLDQASRLDSTLPHVYTSLGAALTSLGSNDLAAAAFAEAIKRDPGDAIAQYNLGTLRLMMGDAADAIPHLEKARDLNPKEPDGRFQLGLAYIQAARPRDAIPEMKEALKLDPNLAIAHVQLALAHLSLGMRREAAVEANLATRAGLKLPAELADLH